MPGNYAIVSQEQTTVRGPAGNFEPAMKITFRTADTNVTGTVTVPLSIYGPEAVAHAIDAYVEKIAAVHNL